MSLIKLKGFRYFDDERQLFEFKNEEFVRKTKYGWHFIRKERGKYLLEKPSVAEVKLEVEGKMKTFDVKDLVIREYGQEKLSRSIFEKFIKDVQEGEKVLYFDKVQGLLIK